MHTRSTKREEEKIRELSREYSKKGYRVVIEPSQEELPDFLKQCEFHPDLVVYGEKESFIVEVKTSQTIRDTEEFTQIADHVRKQKGWDFVFVLTNPKSEALRQDKESSSESSVHILRQLEEAQVLLRSGKQGKFKSAALMVAWAGLEAAMRYSLSALYQKEKSIASQTLIRDSAIYGVISRNDANVIESIMKTRNLMAHGY
jgi:Holliday junction resolvase